MARPRRKSAKRIKREQAAAEKAARKAEKAAEKLASLRVDAAIAAAEAYGDPDEVTLECIQKKQFSIELNHEVWCDAVGECGCTSQPRITSTHDPKTGAIHKIAGQIHCPAMMRIDPGRANAVTVHSAVLDCPGVRRALQVLSCMQKVFLHV